MTDTGIYLYAVAGAEGSPSLEGLAGVAGAPVRKLTHAGLAAYVSTVPLDEFGEEPLKKSMEDLEWLGETARAHHAVVEAVAYEVTTAPVRLVTVYRDEGQVHALLEQRHDDFLDVLARVSGRQEWGVKAYVEPAAPAAAAEEGGSASPGTAYLKRRQANLRSREDAWRDANIQAKRIHDVLRSVSLASRLHRPQDPQLSGREEWMVLNGAYLVDQEHAAEFVQAVKELNEHGITLELTGPWAPYSFTTLETEARGDQ